MLQTARLAEILGGCVSIVYVIVGADVFMTALKQDDLSEQLRGASGALAMIIFGFVAAVCCFKADMPAVRRQIGFLTTLIGKGVFFLIMGFVVFPSVCPRWSYYKRFSKTNCLEDADGDALGWIGIFGSGMSMILGVVMLILQCFAIRESCETNLVGGSRYVTKVDYCAALASVGMIFLSIKIAVDIDFSDTDNLLMYNGVAGALIFFIFGTTSIIAALRNSPFVTSYFGFMDRGWPRGLFYLITGLQIFLVYRDTNKDSNSNLFIYITSVFSVVIGIILIVLAFQ